MYTKNDYERIVNGCLIASGRAACRQGDVALFPVKSVPSDAILQAPTEGELVLALGEVTGHKHQLLGPSSSEILHYIHNDTSYVILKDVVAFVHEKHLPALAPAPGAYRVELQKEYVRGKYRNVAD